MREKLTHDCCGRGIDRTGGLEVALTLEGLDDLIDDRSLRLSWACFYQSVEELATSFLVIPKDEFTLEQEAHHVRKAVLVVSNSCQWSLQTSSHFRTPARL
ncbi:hypothetical protein [Mesorhizobium sp. M0571]|uniref:hypothetical protein n=1 Tax=Mesorhizobium sp. M0571 TaxID=2956960 RepID=UPI0033377577